MAKLIAKVEKTGACAATFGEATFGLFASRSIDLVNDLKELDFTYQRLRELADIERAYIASLWLMCYEWRRYGGDSGLSLKEYINLAMLSYENIVKPNFMLGLDDKAPNYCLLIQSDYFEVVSLERFDVFDANGNERKEVHFMEGLMSVGLVSRQIVRLDNATKQPVINPFKGKHFLKSVIFTGFRA
ncbi:ribonuclease T2 family protein, partial [Striga asiatica]